MSTEPQIQSFMANLFWTRTIKTDGCWYYMRPSRNGYARLYLFGYFTQAHQLAWMIANNQFIPAGMVVCHACDNRGCCRPDHLFLGTQADNVQDMVQKGRHRSARVTHCKRGHEFSGDNVRLNSGRRVCRACHNAANLKWRAPKSRRLEWDPIPAAR